MATLERILNEARRLDAGDLQILHREVSRMCAPLYRKRSAAQHVLGVLAAQPKQAAGYARYQEERERDAPAATS